MANKGCVFRNSENLITVLGGFVLDVRPSASEECDNVHSHGSET